jgi:hypothetical protein
MTEKECFFAEISGSKKKSQGYVKNGKKKKKTLRKTHTQNTQLSFYGMPCFRMLFLMIFFID